MASTNDNAVSLEAISKLLKSVAENTKSNSIAIQKLMENEGSSKRKLVTPSDDECSSIVLKCKRFCANDTEPSTSRENLDNSLSADEDHLFENDEDSSFAENFLLPVDEPVDNDTSDIPILCSGTKGSWQPSSSTLKWFCQVADTELEDSLIDEVTEKFQPASEVEKHFEPPKLPKSIWDRLVHNNSELSNQRNIIKSQKIICNAMMPLLTVLDSMENSDPNQLLLANSIQLLCTSNLKLSKARRTAIAPFVKPDLRKSLFEQPASHLHLFGSEFESCTESAIKAQSSLSRILLPPKSKSFSKPSESRPSGSSRYNKTKPNNEYRSKQPFQSVQRGRTTRFRGNSYRGRRPQDPPKGRTNSKVFEQVATNI